MVFIATLPASELNVIAFMQKFIMALNAMRCSIPSEPTLTMDCDATIVTSTKQFLPFWKINNGRNGRTVK